MASPYYIRSAAAGDTFRVLEDPPTSPSLLIHDPIKIVIVGDSGCGKTSLFSSYVRGSFPSAYEPTIFENHRAFVGNKNGSCLSADLWDTAGQEEYERLRRLSYQDANVVIIAYSVDAPESLPNITDVWAPEVLTYAPDADIIMIALKSDCQHRVDPSIARHVAENIGALAHIQCSSLKMYHVNEVFDAVFNIIINKEEERKNKLHSQINSQKLITDQNTQSNSQSKRRSIVNSIRQNTQSNSNSTSKRKRSSKCVIL